MEHILTGDSLRNKLKSDEEALELAFRLVITAATEEQAGRAFLLAIQIAAAMAPDQVAEIQARIETWLSTDIPLRAWIGDPCSKISVTEAGNG